MFFDEMLKFAEEMRTKYPSGTRIVLDQMGPDPRPIPSGTMATVECVDDLGTVHCRFDNGRHLGLILGEDIFHAVEAEGGVEIEY